MHSYATKRALGHNSCCICDTVRLILYWGVFHRTKGNTPHTLACNMPQLKTYLNHLILVSSMQNMGKIYIEKQHELHGQTAIDKVNRRDTIWYSFAFRAIQRRHYSPLTSLFLTLKYTSCKRQRHGCSTIGRENLIDVTFQL